MSSRPNSIVSSLRHGRGPLIRSTSDHDHVYFISKPIREDSESEPEEPNFQETSRLLNPHNVTNSNQYGTNDQNGIESETLEPPTPESKKKRRRLSWKTLFLLLLCCLILFLILTVVILHLWIGRFVANLPPQSQMVSNGLMVRTSPDFRIGLRIPALETEKDGLFPITLEFNQTIVYLNLSSSLSRPENPHSALQRAENKLLKRAVKFLHYHIEVSTESFDLFDASGKDILEILPDQGNIHIPVVYGDEHPEVLKNLLSPTNHYITFDNPTKQFENLLKTVVDDVMTGRNQSITLGLKPSRDFKLKLWNKTSFSLGSPKLYQTFDSESVLMYPILT
jgi:hypothetical protein